MSLSQKMSKKSLLGEADTLFDRSSKFVTTSAAATSGRGSLLEERLHVAGGRRVLDGKVLLRLAWWRWAVEGGGRLRLALLLRDLREPARSLVELQPRGECSPPKEKS